MSKKAGKTTSEQLRAVQITLWLGADQEVNIVLGKTLSKRLVPDDLDYQRSGYATTQSTADLEPLVREILDKLAVAFPKKEPITLNIDEFDRPIPSVVSGAN